MPAANVEYKDRLFGFLFGNEEHREWTLSLYNAVNGSNYTDASQIQITTIREVLYLGMHNDVSFMISDEMNMYEQQSTYNPNMPLRMLQYAGNLFEKDISRRKKNKYSKHLVRLPVPKLVVFYNGIDDEADEKTLCLSDAFPEEKREAADIEVRVRMINVNRGHSTGMMESCKPLDEYAWLVEAVRRSEEKIGLEAAIDQAIDKMPNEYIIKQFMEMHRAEVKGMLLTEYNEVKQMELVREEGREEGRKEGREEGRKEGREEGREEGRKEGREEERTTLWQLITRLIDVGRNEDVTRAANDAEYREQLYKEFHIV